MNPTASKNAMRCKFSTPTSPILSGSKSKNASPSTAPAENDVIRWDLSLNFIAKRPPKKVNKPVSKAINSKEVVIYFIHRL